MADDELDYLEIQKCHIAKMNESPLNDFTFGTGRMESLMSVGGVIAIKSESDFSYISNIAETFATPSLLIDFDEGNLRERLLKRRLLNSAMQTHQFRSALSSFSDGFPLYYQQQKLKAKHKFVARATHECTSLKHCTNSLVETN